MKPNLFRHFPVLAVDKMLDPQHERKMDEVRGDGERMQRKGNEKAKKKNELKLRCKAPGSSFFRRPGEALDTGFWGRTGRPY
jgi:hypothetical protein